MFDFKIITKPQFTLIGYSRKFNSKTSYKEIPKFWQEHYSNKGADIVCGMYGVCFDCNDNGDFSYMIADDYVPIDEVPTDMEVKVIPERTWAVFPCKGALPKSLQDVNTYIFTEWLPNSTQYRMAGDLNIEAYFESASSNPDDDYSEIWIPVEEKQ